MKKILSLVMMTLLLVGMFASTFSVSASTTETRLSQASKWDGNALTVSAIESAYTFKGEGTEASPYLIESAEDLAKLAANVNFASTDTSYAGKFFKLTCDIDMNDKKWTGIGNGNTDKNIFSGSFDGDGHVIFNLQLKDAQYSGVFGAVGMGATVKNLGIVSGEVSLTNGRTGSLIGCVLGNVTVSNCFSWANIKYNGNGHTGGLIGVMMNNGAAESNTRLIKDCYYSGTFQSGTGGSNPSKNYAFGGIVGAYWDSTSVFENCYFNGKMEITTYTTTVDSAYQHAIGAIAGGAAHAVATTVSTFTNCKVGGTITHTNAKADFSTYVTGMGHIVGSMYHPTFSATGCVSALDMKLNGTAVTVAVGTDKNGAAYATQPEVATAESVSVPLAEGSKCFMVAVASDIANTLELGIVAESDDTPVEELQLPTAPTTYTKYTTTDEAELARYNAASKWDGIVYNVLSLDEVYKFDGKGTKSEPYLLNSADDVAKLAANVRFDNKDTTYLDQYFKLTCDIDLDGKPWMGIGGCSTTASWNDNIMFSGIFDGDGHVVYNFNLANTTEAGEQIYYNGFFGYAGKSYCEIRNFGIVNGDVFLGGEGLGPTRTAALVGASRYDIVLDNCFNKANMTFVFDGKGEPRVGGLMGAVMNDANTYREIKNCYNEGNLTLYAKGTSNNCIGGIAGYLSDGETLIENCYNTGDITVYADSESDASQGKFRAVGSIVGSLAWKGTYTFDSCVAGGTITYTNVNTKYTAPIGSIVGYVNDTSTLAVTDCKYGAALKDYSVVGEWAGVGTMSGTEVATVEIPMSAADKYFISTVVHTNTNGDTVDDGTGSTGGNVNDPTAGDSTQNTPADDTQAPVTQAPADTAAPGEKSGCGSSVAMAPIAVCAVLGMGISVLKKRR